MRAKRPTSMKSANSGSTIAGLLLEQQDDVAVAVRLGFGDGVLPRSRVERPRRGRRSWAKRRRRGPARRAAGR
ncbi:MAG: hypothetical protein MZU97_11570 [Bacillus subtilis]|nr:hypothetical protein [Bacillus subtilis]